ncbi:unnamed protein product [Cyprideis torosa]|uniref:Uncharacterized protein n=1 Tax=Cyprideis torosa TaxID=163714 RepID=A0A7R8W719_9CRUS|nr:unnamed protein product [Cyprideis torosa]CAG0885822.1 unnamed protein product [Cyprideis torosa]
MVADQIAIKEILIKRFNDFLDHRMSDVMSLCVGSMIERIKDDKSKTPTDVPTDVRRLFRTLTVDVISRCVYGITFRDLYDENSEIIRHADAVFATSDMSSPLLFLLLLINITNTFFGMKSFQFFVSMTEFILKSRRRDDPKGTISYEMLGECTYLEAYLKECLRMYPPVPRLERVATSDSVIAGIPITKGQLIQIPVYAIHYSSEQYSDPRKFNPERWRVNTKQDSSSAWLPFGAGPRNCIGMRFAMEQTKLAIGNLVYQFTLHPSPNMKVLRFFHSAA